MMTLETVREAFAACRKLLPETTTAERGSDIWQRHLVFMCEEGARYAEHRREKAMRWLGFVQGALWAHGLAPVSELKTMNRPGVTQRQSEEPKGDG
jgi:hypothetical protein